MIYTNFYSHLIIISICLVLGILIGVIGMLITTARDVRHINEELDKFRLLYFNELDSKKSNFNERHRCS